MQNKKYQLFCLLLSASVAVSSPAATIMAATRTSSVAMSEADWQEMAEEDSGEWDDDELFQDYLSSLFFQTPEGVSCCSLDTTGKSTLNETEKKLYNDLKPLIREVAEGKRTSTEFEIDVSAYGDVFMFTADSGTTLTQESVAAKFAAVVDTSKVWHALLADMPYELYWHDKTIDGWSAGFSYSSFDNYKTASITKLTIGMGVNAKYAEKSADGRSYNANQMSTDTQNTVQRAQKAAAKARSIVADNAGKSDYDKLYSYMTAICDLTSYHTSAPGSPTNTFTEGIDPWQLIYVFDGDGSTKVVCEGYAKAFAYLCDLSKFSNPNITCYTVSGTMQGGTGAGGHMWNIVTMDDNRNYLVDVTNCDEGTIGSPDKLFLAGLSGTAASSYKFSSGSGKTVIYTYDTEIKGLYGTGSDSVLTLANQKYSKKALETLTDDQVKSMVRIPSDSTYNGQEVSATLTNQVGGTGTATIFYQKEGSAEYVTEAPKDAGIYKVYLSVTEGSNYHAVEKAAVGSFTIARADAGITLGNLSQTEGSVSAVTASLSPASADASATLEYLVTKDGKETWTTELPKTAGSYKVRAFLGTAHAGKNLKGYADFEEAKTAGKAAEGTLAISKASSGTGTEKPSEGTPGSETPETVTNPDGSTTTVSSATREDGTTVRVEETLREDGSRKTAVTESRPDGTTKTTTTAADSEGNTTSVTEKTTMDTVGKGTNAVVTVKKDGEGSVTSAKASVDLTGKSGRVSIDGATVKAITEAAGTDTDITMTVKDSKGKTLYTLTADSADLKAGNSLKVFKYSAKKGYVLVNAKTYKASKSGSVSVSLKDKAAYRLEDTKTAAKIEKQILNSVKPAKTSAKIKTGKSMKASLAGSFHQENAKSISYSTTDKKVVKVSKNGTVKALKKGTASVKIKAVLKNGKTKTVTVNLTVK